MKACLRCAVERGLELKEIASRLALGLGLSEKIGRMQGRHHPGPHGRRSRNGRQACGSSGVGVFVM